MSERINTVVSDIIDAVRQVMVKHQVTNAELVQAIDFLEATGLEKFEVALMMRNFFETTTAEIANSQLQGSSVDIEGPYFLENAPDIGAEGEIKTLEKEGGEPITIRGKVTDIQGNPISGVTLDIWHSTPKGTYSGVHPDIPEDHYRAKLTTGEDGCYQVKTTRPVPYQIPNQGHTGMLLELMGRHSWRPAHVHFLARKEGLLEHITQVYFEGGDYVKDDCCQAVVDDCVLPLAMESGSKVITKDFVLDPA